MAEMEQTEAPGERLELVNKLDTILSKLQAHEKILLSFADKLGMTPEARVRLARSERPRRSSWTRTEICLETEMAVRKQNGLHHPVSVYAKQVTRGRLHDLCCPYEIKACQRHLDDLKRQGTEDFPYVFDTTRADRIIRWFGQCIQTRGVEHGQPIQLQPWQVFDLGCTYGWVHKEDGARRFKRTYNKRGPRKF